MIRTAFAIALVATSALPVSSLRAQSHSGHGADHGSGHATSSDYAGQQNREIKALSPDDLAQLRRGGGWGLARAAELNGAPGPAHVLELADELDLDPEQRDAVAALHERMKDEAVEAGDTFIAAERALDAAFADGAPSADELTRLVRHAAEAHGALRLVHLRYHLETLPVLEDEQVTDYRRLRDYADD